jgi:ABC-type Na+ efflux pump permease subunit
MRAQLDRNPVEWLQHYSWSGRMTRWGWCLFLVIVECSLLTLSFGDMRQWQHALQIVLAGGVAFTAVGSFRNERENGALELMLVTPLEEFQILWGRLRGILQQFFPSILVLVVIWMVIIGNSTPRGNWFLMAGMHPYTLQYILSLGSSVLVMALAGFYFSTRPIHFLVGWLLTILVGLVLPAMGAAFIGMGVGGVILIQLILAYAAWQLLHQSLKKRDFALAR